jgi:hypothetical protein
MNMPGTKEERGMLGKEWEVNYAYFIGVRSFSSLLLLQSRHMSPCLLGLIIYVCLEHIVSMNIATIKGEGSYTYSLRE